ncbi:CDP-alcohol phosphatidyltransferase-domain-containing protein [Blastocladiella britannica]|nr:CDP-alcohol phosphatidyltransferase-domain-containing protein [Blastocladiella britannica]
MDSVDYLSDRALANLRLYRYSAVDKSPTSQYILRHYWNWAVTLFPMWMAPNLITLIGFCFVWINLLFIVIWMPDLEGPAPAWMYFSFAAGIWLYSTFDNVDGKQARRTGTSSPLGELFDHGCDALNCSVGAIVQAASLGLGHTWYTGAIVFMTTIAFYFSTWEEYHTGTLYLGYLNGPTEGLIIACIMSIISGIKGPQVWHQLATDALPAWMTVFPASWSLIDYSLTGMLILLFTLNVPFSIHAVYRVCRGPTPKSSFREACVQVVPMAIFLACNAIWLAAPYSIALEQHVILFMLANGIVFGRMATKIILAHVTKMPFPMFSTGLLIPLAIGAALVLFPSVTGIVILTPTLESIYIWGYAIAAAITYMHWAVVVINKFCAYLDINCLTIKKRRTGALTYIYYLFFYYFLPFLPIPLPHCFVFVFVLTIFFNRCPTHCHSVSE